MALGALAAIGGFTPGVTTVEAAPSVSPFAGTYVGRDPRGWYPSLAVTVSDAGRIASGKAISGLVSDDGSYSFTVSITGYAERGGREGGGPKIVTSSYTSTGTMSLDAAGNIVGTTNTVSPFTWTRQ
jgi:hypothetical protein